MRKLCAIKMMTYKIKINDAKVYKKKGRKFNDLRK
jgi:hypothetical protein